MNMTGNQDGTHMTESLAMEHYRLHIIERWPEGAAKQAALMSVRSALAGLLRSRPDDTARWTCIVCNSRAAAGTVHAA